MILNKYLYYTIHVPNQRPPNTYGGVGNRTRSQKIWSPRPAPADTPIFNVWRSQHFSTYRDIFMKKVLLTFLLILLLPFTTDAVDPFTVRVIYFASQDSDPVNHAKYDKTIKEIQTFFKQEMIRHQHGDKTFTLETDDGNLKIHSIEGKHAGDRYTGEIFRAYYNHISKEIPFEINNTKNRKAQDDVYIVIVGGVELVNDGLGSPWGGGWTFQSALGGTAIINENFEKKYPHHYTSIIAHELAHAFGLKHNKFDDSLLGSLPWGGPSYLTDFEAHVLNTSHFFNDIHIQNPSPEFVGKPHLTSIGDDIVQFNIDVLGHAELSYCQVSISQDYVGSTILKNRVANVQIDIPRKYIANNPQNFDVLLIDVNGNKTDKMFKNIQIPEPEIIEEPAEEIIEEPAEEITNPDENKTPDLSVSSHNKLITSWASMKAR